ncbi:MAG TPA: GNAT family N-acetyltransferase, partial [Egibacteraceae bacterium]|nr:GNAT family N-acetyltransferase [Egibacteraceae bacterium]
MVVEPAGPGRWADVERLFGTNGACGGCWCMYPRLKASEFDERKGEGNRAALRELVEAGTEPGLLASRDGEPAGWVAIGPREQYGRLSRSPVCKPVDDLAGVWSVVCFFIPRANRRQGLSKVLLDAAVSHAFARGAAAVEGYPVEPQKPDSPDVFAWWGTAQVFRAAGFTEL